MKYNANIAEFGYQLLNYDQHSFGSPDDHYYFCSFFFCFKE